jgi:hypothetical protein
MLSASSMRQSLTSPQRRSRRSVRRRARAASALSSRASGRLAHVSRSAPRAACTSLFSACSHWSCWVSRSSACWRMRYCERRPHVPALPALLPLLSALCRLLYLTLLRALYLLYLKKHCLLCFPYLVRCAACCDLLYFVLCTCFTWCSICLQEGASARAAPL